MQKSDYLNMIKDNVLVFNINLSPEFQGEKLDNHLNNFDENSLKIIAGCNQYLLEYFLTISKGKSQKDMEESLKKMEKLSYMIGPTGNLSYLGSNQIEYILTKLDSLILNEISEAKISLIADEQLEKEFGAGQYNESTALENQLASAEFYLKEMGYSHTDIQAKIREIKLEPKKLDELFNLPPKEIYSVPPELEGGGDGLAPSNARDSEITQEVQKAISRHVQSIHHDLSEQRVKKINEIMEKIKAHVKDDMNDEYEKVYVQIHPDRLNRALKVFKETKRKSKRQKLLLEWFFTTHLLENIEVRVEHWQTSARADRSAAGVYTAGISFCRYDQIVREFSDSKFSKVINITRRILQKPSKKAIQKLGQDLVAETGFEEHLYFYPDD